MMLRAIIPVLLLIAGLAVAGSGLPIVAHAQDSLSSSEPSADEVTAELLVELSRTSDAKKAEQLEQKIWARWSKSGSDTVDLLMSWADEAQGKENLGQALDLLDRVVLLEPGFAHGLNRRAIVHYSRGDHAKSLDDIERVIALEPNHFGAISGLGAIMMELNKEQAALDAFMRVLEIYPANEKAQEAASKLIEKLSGDAV